MVIQKVEYSHVEMNCDCWYSIYVCDKWSLVGQEMKIKKKNVGYGLFFMEQNPEYVIHTVWAL